MRASRRFARWFACSKSSRDAMNLLPCSAQLVQMLRQDARYAPDLAPREPIVLSEFYRSRRTVQTENSLATVPNYVDVGRSMIIGIDHNPQPVESENRRH